MGLRGPLRNPNSRRAQAELRKRQKDAKDTEKRNRYTVATEPECMPDQAGGEIPTYPECFTRRQAEAFQNLVTDLLAARVPLKRVDSHAIAMAVRCLSAIEGAELVANHEDSTIEQRLGALRLISGFGKDLKDWLQIICAAPGARARIGLKAPVEKKAGPVAQMLAARQGRKP